MLSWAGRTKVASLMLVALALLLCAGSPSALADTCNITLPTAAATAGGADFVVPVMVNDATGALGLSFHFTYDPTRLAATAVYKTAFTDAFQLITNLSTPGAARFALYNTAPLSGGGVVAYVMFHTLSGAPLGDSPLLWVSADINEGTIPATTCDGLVTVMTPQIVISTPDFCAAPGSTVTHSVSATPALGLVSLDLVIDYNPLVVEPTAVTPTAYTVGFAVFYNIVTPGQLMVSLYGTTPLSGAGPLVDIAWHVLAGNGYVTPLDLVVGSVNEGTLTSALDDAVVTVAPDSDADGVTVCTDCDDADPDVYPGAPEICDGIDNQCPGDVGYGQVDENVKLTFYRDSDGDAHGDAAVTVEACAPPPGYVASGDDCDDTDAAIHPGATETAGDGVDSNCDGLELCYVDGDGDSYGSSTTVLSPRLACNGTGESNNADDCNDGNAAIHPGATEACNGIDDDCDGAIDEGVKLTYYRDADADGYGNAANNVLACSPPSGYVADASDCNDASAAIYPGATETPADGIDSNCDGFEVCFVDADHDTYGSTSTVTSTNLACSTLGEATNATDCDDTLASVHPGATEVCNDIDDDCDGATDEGVKSTFYADADNDTFGNAAVSTEACTAPSGFVADATDCDDTRAFVNPGAPEVCDGLDDDCDTLVDEGVKSTFYADADNDAFGNAAVSTEACTAPSGYVADATDCDDAHASAHPGATEVCDTIDNDCDGSIDEGVTTTFFADADGDGYGDAASTTQACAAPSGFVSNASDCDDTRASVNPAGTEACNGIDDDCDGATDEGVKSTFYADADSDTFGNAAVSTEACTAPSGYVADATDCDDAHASAHPGATEVCDTIDNDCDGSIDEGVTTTFFADADGDGYGNAASTTQACTAPSGYVADATDCDDTHSSAHPGATEVCDTIDNDCDGSIDEGVTTTFFADTDSDGYGSAGSPIEACSVPSGYVSNASDCDDTRASVNPAGTEVCNGIDDDCDGATDEGVTTTFFADADGDGYGDAASTTQACAAPSGFVSNASDCDDTRASVNPAGTEVCNSIDDDCDGATDEGVTTTFFADADGDGYGDAASTTQACAAPSGFVSNASDCDDTRASVNPAGTEACNGIDDDCDGATDEGVKSTFYADADSDTFGNAAVSTEACTAPSGYVADATDCDDAHASAHPGATEACDTIDNDCDGSIDEGVTTTFFADADGDGYGNAASTTQACTAPSGYVADATDCDDTHSSAHPGATEVCDTIDNDCDGSIDEGVTTTFFADADGDGYGDAASTTQACAAPSGFVSNASDCDDTRASVNPAGTEVCNGIDDDCDGATDEGVTTTFFADADGDGYGDAASTTQACAAPSGFVSNASDCDDTRASVNPAGTEVCNSIDDDCDGATDEGVTTTFFADADGDGYGDAASTTQACAAPSGFVSNASDCDDTRASVNPAGTEACNGIDDDCDGATDEGVKTTFYADADNDTFGNAAVSTEACTAPSGYVADATDCDDTRAFVNPAAPEVCDGLDDDCDTLVDEGVKSTFYADTDSDTFGNAAASTEACTAPSGFVADATDCDDTDAAVHPGAAEVCNGIDDDCDGATDEGVKSTFYADADGDGYGNATVTTQACAAPSGYVADATDCDDTRATVNPAGTETCNDLDDDCDGAVDEGVKSTFYADADADGFGNAASPLLACTLPPGAAANSADCDDTRADIHPGATEVCDGLDDDCDGLFDEGNPGGGVRCGTTNLGECATGLTACTGGSVQCLYTVAPQAETCDNRDNDCDGVVDNSCAAPACNVNLPLESKTAPGEDFVVPITVSNAAGALGMTFQFTYDPARITALAAYRAELTDAFGLDFNVDVPGTVTISLYGSTPLASGGTVAYVMFHTSGSALGATPLHWTMVDVNEDTSPACDGTVNVVAQQVTIRMNDFCGAPGNSVTTSITSPDATGVYSLDLTVEYDPAVLAPTNVATTAFTAGYLANFHVATPGRLAISLFGTTALSGSGALADVTWQMQAGAVNDSPVDLATVEVNESEYLVVLDDALFHASPDADADGYAACVDCNDADARIHPHATEVCDGVDNQCPGDPGYGLVDEGVELTFHRDADADGYGDASLTTIACSAPAGYVADATDCDDTRANVHPTAAEVCDGLDNDCNGTVDEGVKLTFHRDADADGYGDPSDTQLACTAPPGFVADGADCNDGNAAVNPGATEVCNGIDDDCDSAIDEGVRTTYYADVDADGYGNSGVFAQACTAPSGYVTDGTDCDDTNGAIHPGATEVPADGYDYNCDGHELCYLDGDHDGFGTTSTVTSADLTCSSSGVSTSSTDCDDGDAAVHPGATETCNGIDDNCDGHVDEGVTSTFHADTDADGFGNPAVAMQACTAPSGYVADGTDCDDGDAAVHPGATETCNGIDDNCDGQTDEGVKLTFFADTDADGFGNSAAPVLACSLPPGASANSADCDDTNAAVHPGATETCNGIDDNCDSAIDEGNPGGGMRCGTSNVGECATGLTACTGGSVQCLYTVAPQAETCDNRDNDCDGVVDNDCTAPACNVNLPLESKTAPGEDFVVPITVTNAAGALGMTFEFTYDPARITALAAYRAELTDAFGLDFNVDVPGTVTISLYGSTPLASGGTVAYVLFHTSGTTLGPTPLHWTLVDVNENTSSACDGTVHLTATQMTVGMDDFCGAPGNSVTTAVTSPNATGLNSLDLTVEYDPLVLAPTNVATTALTAGFVTNFHVVTPGRLAISLFGATPLAGGGSLLDVTWQMQAGGTNDSPVDLATVEVNEGAYLVTLDDALFHASPDGDGDGYAACVDCNDGNAAIHPHAAEICDGIDNQCPGDAGYGLVDEGVQLTFHRDADSDGYGDPALATQACTAPAGYVADATDCDDTTAAVHPGAAEVCDGLDNDCNGHADDPAAPSAAVQLGAEHTPGHAIVLTWGSVSGATGYDVVRGLSLPLFGAGDFAAAVESCMANDTSATTLTDGTLPPAGEIFWYAVRAVNCGGNGTWDASPNDQVGSRDPGINSAPAACP